jgi:hypothetical protein
LTAVRKLENAVLKFYLVNAVMSGKPDKVMEFFAKCTPELIGQPEWKEWFSKLLYSFVHFDPIKCERLDLNGLLLQGL